ncbi:hypothetical protein LJPFL01_0905 [Lelliottia jeotgali]|nr:hypothetical protein LJPFL01_0905 [Lelliottia jeotgali]
MSSMVLITKDNYLYDGIKQFLPVRHLQEIIYSKEHSSECLVLIDSRVSLRYLEDVYSWLSALFDKTKALVLKMESETCQASPMQRRHNAVDMKSPGEQIACDILSELDTFSADKWQRKIYVEINERETTLIRSLLADIDVEEIAKRLCCSYKQVYKLRDKMCQRLNAKNFYTVCLYVFRHDLLNRQYLLPVTWLRG